MIEVELVRDERNGVPVVAVIVRYGATLIQTPFVIDDSEQPARDVAKALKILFPDTPQTHKGFTWTSKA